VVLFAETYMYDCTSLHAIACSSRDTTDCTQAGRHQSRGNPKKTKAAPLAGKVSSIPSKVQ
jgi:hypothetical protein